jgi:uracil DNA glycosylase
MDSVKLTGSALVSKDLFHLCLFWNKFISGHGDLSEWTSKVSFSTPSSLSGPTHQANSQKESGWGQFTLAVVLAESELEQPCLLVVELLCSEGQCCP